MIHLLILASDRSGITLCPLCYPRVPPSSIPRSNPKYRLEQPLQSACTDERIQDVPKYCVHHPLISHATHSRISAGLPRSSCLSIAKLFNLLFSVLLQRPSSRLSGIISSYIKDVALPGLQRNMEREMMINVRSKRWKRESGVVSSQTQYQACWSWTVLARFEYGTS